MKSLKKFIKVLIEKEYLNTVNNNLNSVDSIHNIVLLPAVTFHNYLPYEIKYEVFNNSEEEKPSAKKVHTEKKKLEPGASVKLIDAKFGSNLIIEVYIYKKSFGQKIQSVAI